MKTRLLIIEDQKEYQITLGTALCKEFSLTFASTATQAIEYIDSKEFDLYLIDIVLPDGNGLEISDYIKSKTPLASKPIIMVTSRDSLEDKIEGFDHGADDYITKPFHYKELIARIKARCKYQSQPSPAASPRDIFKFDNFSVNMEQQTIEVHDKSGPVNLTRIEFKLFIALIKSPGEPLSREEIIHLVWPDKPNMTNRTIDTHISNLRKKISSLDVHIDPIHGKGYVFNPAKKAS